MNRYISDLNALHDETTERASPSPNIWGGPLWKILHNASIYYRYSELSAEEMCSFVRGLPAIIPCGTCKRHVRNMLGRISQEDLWDVASNRWRMFQFFVDLHNKVNQRLGKVTVSPIRAYTALTGKTTSCLNPNRYPSVVF